MRRRCLILVGKAALAKDEAPQEREFAVMIGGAPFFMPPLQKALLEARISVRYAFSRRISHEEMQPDGSVRKTQTFTHAGWVKVNAGCLL